METLTQFASGTVPYQLILDLHNLYLTGKHRLLSSALKTKEETKTIWFELNASMRRFLQDTLDDEKVSGIRVYFLAYPDTQQEMDGVEIPVDPLDVGQLTIGIVTTQEIEGRHPDYPETNEGIKMLFADPMNHGELCPQKCNS